MKKSIVLGVCLLLWTGTIMALAPSAEELAAKKRWMDAKFDGIVQPEPKTPGIQVIENHEALQFNTRNGGPLKIGDVVYEHGLFAHAPSNIRVTLPQPGKKLTAVVGVDAAAGEPGVGSVQFSVVVQDKTLFESEICHCAEPGVPVDVDLDGADQFYLRVSDGGDHFHFDQADWADASVELEDGSVLHLSDLPLQSDDLTYATQYPFSFIYDGKESSTFLSSWTREEKTEDQGDGRTFRTISFLEPDGPLQVDCVITEYDGFPMIEWTLNFINRSADQETPIVENIKVLDSVFSRKVFVRDDDHVQWAEDQAAAIRNNNAREFMLFFNQGAHAYVPDSLSLTPETSKTFTSYVGGSNFPNFNLRSGQDRGWIIVMGWQGAWKGDFVRDKGTDVQVQLGQEIVRYKLLPNEKVSSPVVVVQPWFRDSWLYAQNVWRAWMLKYNVPRQNGKLVESQLNASSSRYTAETTIATTENQKAFIDGYLREGIQLDYWWIDAGWYPCHGPWGWGVFGTWEPDLKRFPKGLREISDYGKSKGVELIVWFNPEEVTPGSWVAENHPEYVWGGDKGGLLKLSEKEPWEWLVNHLDKTIKEQGIAFYRTDFMAAPVQIWRANDAPDRQGITEIRYGENFLAYFDELLKRNPGLRIDVCSGGGRRNELLALRRAVPLWRSDYAYEAKSQQVQTYGISLWIPLYGTCMRYNDDYRMRSLIVPYQGIDYDVRLPEQREDVAFGFGNSKASGGNQDYDIVRKNLKIREDYIVPYFTSDFYPLTECNMKTDVWLGWQYNSPEKEGGVIQMFRREDAPYTDATFKLYGLDTDAEYEFTDVDTGVVNVYSGKELTENGLPLHCDKSPQALIVSYKKR